MIRNIFLNNYVFIYELVGLFILLNIGVHLSERMKKTTRIVLILIALETVFFYLENWTQTFDHVTVFRPLLTAAIYSLYPVIVIVLMQLAAQKPFSKKKLIMLFIPEIICVPLYFSSQWTHLVFYYKAPNNFAGGNPVLCYLPYILFGFYVVLFVIDVFRTMKRTSPVSLWFSISYIVFGSVIGGLFFISFDARENYSPLLMSAILLYYVYVYIHMAKIDPLTSLLNRQSFYKVVQSNPKTVTGVISVDMNDLKFLNDNFGHEEGDKALCEVAKILSDYCGKGGFVYRVGGDEFVIVYKGVKEAKIVETISVMKDRLAGTAYSCAFGYAMRKSNESINTAVKNSDQMMYLNKAIMKAKKKQPVVDPNSQTDEEES